MTLQPNRFVVSFLAILASSILTKPSNAQNLFQVDARQSRVYIRVDTATRLGHAHGVQGNCADSTLTLGGKGQMVFDMTSFIADTPEARQNVGLEGKFADAQKVTANMLGESVLNVAEHPRAVFNITSMNPLDGQTAGMPGRYQITGQFTLRGVTQPLQFPSHVEQTDRPGVMRLRGQFTILQTRFGIQPFSAVGGLVRVADELKVWGDLVLTPVGH